MKTHSSISQTVSSTYVRAGDRFRPLCKRHRHPPSCSSCMYSQPWLGSHRFVWRNHRDSEARGIQSLFSFCVSIFYPPSADNIHFLSWNIIPSFFKKSNAYNNKKEGMIKWNPHMFLRILLQTIFLRSHSRTKYPLKICAGNPPCLRGG